MAKIAVLLLVIVYSSCIEERKAASEISCRVTGSDASCEPESSNLCEVHEAGEEIDACWPGARAVQGNNPNIFSDATPVGFCPSESYKNSYGRCVPSVPSNSDSGAHHKVQDVSITFKPVNIFSYNMIVSWSYLNNDPSPVGVQAYRVALIGGPSLSFYDRCTCINSTLNLTQLSFNVEYRPWVGPLTVEVFTHPYASNAYADDFIATVHLEVSNAPITCADYNTGLQYDTKTCGLPRYGRPGNVTMKQISNSTVLSWETPCFKTIMACDLYKHGLSYHKPEIYYVTLLTNGVEHNFKVTNTTEIILNATNIVVVSIFAYIPCSGIYEYRSGSGRGNGCSQPGDLNEDETDTLTCCSSALIPTTRPFPTASPILSPTDPPNHLYVVLIVTITTVTVIIIVSVVVCIIIYFNRPTPNPETNYTSLNVTAQILIIYSLRTPVEDKKCILQCLVKEISNYGICSLTLDTECPRTNFYDWIAENYEKVNAIICVCNKYFYEDWNQTVDRDHSFPLVLSFKNLFESNISSKKYAVVRTSNDWKDYVPLFLQNRPVFMLDDYKGIARFALDVPEAINVQRNFV